MTKYFEIKVESPNYKLFKDFVFELGVSCVEEIENGFIMRERDDKEIVYGLKEFEKALAKTLNLDPCLKIEVTQKEDRDWIESYKKSVMPIQIGKLYIHPSWHSPKDGLINITIDPALAFGSGHHESTSGCLEMIEKYATKGSNALDVGCGSGILAIVLNKLGVSVDICDTDSQAIDAAKENFRKNGAKFESAWVGSVGSAKKSYDLVVANIIADIILILQNDLKKYVKRDGKLILSGILDNYLDRIKKSFSDFKLIEELQKNEWVTLVYENKGEK